MRATCWSGSGAEAFSDQRVSIRTAYADALGDDGVTFPPNVMQVSPRGLQGCYVGVPARLNPTDPQTLKPAAEAPGPVLGATMAAWLRETRGTIRRAA